MRTRNALERLACAAPAVEVPIDAAEEDRILARILASGRPVTRARPPIALAIVAAVVAAAAIVYVAAVGHSNPTAPQTSVHQSAALTGVRIAAAGYHFRTPAGFTSSNAACGPSPAAGAPTTVLNGFSAAASADGGCVSAAFLVSVGPSSSAAEATPAGQPVDVGTYQGYFDSGGSPGESMLFVELPKADGSQPAYLALYAQGLTEDQLVAVAESGLPASP